MIRNPVWAEDDPAGGSLATGADPENSPSEPADNQPSPEPDWAGNLPDTIKPKVTKFKSPEDLAKSYVELESRMGKSVQVPGKDASDEEWSNWYKRIGRPDSPDGYELSNVERDANLPKDAVGIEADFARTVHQNGLSKEQARNLWKFWLERSAKTMQLIKQKRNEELANVSSTLRSELGSEYNSGVELMKRVVNRFADKEAKSALNEGLGNDPRLIRMLINIGKVMSEDTLEGRVPTTPEEQAPEPGVFTYDHSPEMVGENRFGRARR